MAVVTARGLILHFRVLVLHHRKITISKKVEET